MKKITAILLAALLALSLAACGNSAQTPPAAGTMLSGIVLSCHALTFLPISGGQSWARTLHLLCAYWGFVVLSLHLGFHWNGMMGLAKKAFPAVLKARAWLLTSAACAS